jgi:hypothetical protein
MAMTMSSRSNPAFAAGPPVMLATILAPRGCSQPKASASTFVRLLTWAPSQVCGATGSARALAGVAIVEPSRSCMCDIAWIAMFVKEKSIDTATRLPTNQPSLFLPDVAPLCPLAVLRRKRCIPEVN